MGFTPKQLRRRFDVAAKRVAARGNRPPWTDHPPVLDLALSITNELSAREARWVHNHLTSCRICLEHKERLQQQLDRAQTQQEALDIVRSFERAARTERPAEG